MHSSPKPCCLECCGLYLRRGPSKRDFFSSSGLLYILFSTWTLHPWYCSAIRMAKQFNFLLLMYEIVILSSFVYNKWWIYVLNIELLTSFWCFLKFPLDAFGSSASEPQPTTQAASSSSASADLLAGNKDLLKTCYFRAILRNGVWNLLCSLGVDSEIKYLFTRFHSILGVLILTRVIYNGGSILKYKLTFKIIFFPCSLLFYLPHNLIFLYCSLSMSVCIKFLWLCVAVLKLKIFQATLLVLYC